MAAKPDPPLARYARIIEAVGGARDGMALSDIARAAGLQVGTAHRLVHSLLDVGLLDAVEGTRLYVLGTRLLRLLHLTALPGAVISGARPLLRGLVERFGETAFLARLSGGVVETVAVEQPGETARSFVHPGREMPMHATASGKAILAFQDDAFVEALLARPRRRFTAGTLTEAAAIRDEMRRVRHAGFAVCDNEMDGGVLSYACPVRLDGRHVFHSVGLVGFADRLRPVPAGEIREALAAVAATLGGRSDGPGARPAADGAD